MTTEEAPRLEDFSDGLPQELPPTRKSGSRVAVRVAIGVLLIVALLLGFSVLSRMQALPIASHGTGRVIGRVVGEDGRPLQAQVFVINTDLEASTDTQGRFTLNNVPAGEQSLVVAYQGAGREYPVIVEVGTVTDVGEIRFVSTRVPES